MTGTTNDGYTRRSGPRDRGLRVGDSEREAVADVLREQHVQGRLVSHEFQERLERCLAAKTYSDLDVLIEDLPIGEAPNRRGWGLRPWPFVLVPLIAIAIVASHGHLFWLAFPLIFFFVIRPVLWACRPRYTNGRRA